MSFLLTDAVSCRAILFLNEIKLDTDLNYRPSTSCSLYGQAREIEREMIARQACVSTFLGIATCIQKPPPLSSTALAQGKHQHLYPALLMQCPTTLSSTIYIGLRLNYSGK